jgi:hypothetical protein
VSAPGIRDSGFGIRRFDVRDAGDAAILLELEPVIDPAVNAARLRSPHPFPVNGSPAFAT